jgi:hypothetical protein
MQHLTIKTVRLIQQIQDNIIIVIAALGAFFLPIQPLMLLVGMMILLDTITGLWKAYKIKERISSRKLSNVVSKMVLYQGVVITLFILEKYALAEFVTYFIEVPYFLTKLISIILIMIELMSMHENFEVITKINLWKAFKKIVTRGQEAKNDLVELTNLNNKNE